MNCFIYIVQHEKALKFELFVNDRVMLVNTQLSHHDDLVEGVVIFGALAKNNKIKASY